MELTQYQIDAFATKPFEGNPAAVCPLEKWLPDDVMQSIALENNLSETAFFVPTDNGFHIRWFTPVREVDLCGHATLASAYVLFDILKYDRAIIDFNSRSGFLSVKKEDDWLVLDFPVQPLESCEIPEEITNAFTATPIECLKSMDFVVVFENEEEIKTAKPNFAELAKIDTRGVIITAESDQYDFVSRFFAPASGIPEDPVTGSAYTQLAPYWQSKLGPKRFKVKQVSERGGELLCEVAGDRVLIYGKAVKFMEGKINITI